MFAILASTLTSYGQAAPTIRVANNNPGAAIGTNVYTGTTAIQDALAAAVAGDIIYAVPSAIAYGSITIDKAITIFGIGIRPDKDLALKSKVGPIYLNASNVRISGITGPTNGGVLIEFGLSNVTYTDITIENSKFREIRQTNTTTVTLDRVLIRNNIIINLGWQGVEFYTTSNVTITNNVIYCSRTSGSITGIGLILFNNLFVGDGTANARAVAMVNACEFDHNIFFGTFVNVTSSSPDNVWNDNLSFGSTNDVFSIGSWGNKSTSPNIEGADPLFVGMPKTDTWNNAHDFTLQAGSPALNINGTDIGPSGGTTPFDDEGNLLPLIQTVSVPAIIPLGTDLPVTIKAKGN